MADREKVLKGLECCILRNPDDHARCSQCPYGSNCVNRLKMGALELLKEQQKQRFFVDSDGKLTPLPVQKHGHWKGFTQSRYFGTDDDGEPIFRDGLFYVCSECRRKSIIRYPYCPRCGAKMDEEVKQNETD